MQNIPNSPLRILHAVCLPEGGILRHILDLANAQIEYGHHVGIIAGDLTDSERANAALAEIAPHLKLGLYRLPIRRKPHPIDVFPAIAHLRLIRQLKPDVLHGHDAKAGVFLRLKSASRTSIRVYTPHGDSLHFPPHSLKGAIYAHLERALMNRTDLFLFESTFARNTYERVVGRPHDRARVVFNGVTAREFNPVITADDATDLLYVGQLHRTKGVDLLIDAVARLHADGKPVTLTLAGDGDSEETRYLKAQINRLNLKLSASLNLTIRVRLSRKDEFWWFLRWEIQCSMWLSKQPQPAFQSLQQTPAAFRKSSDPIPPACSWPTASVR